MRLIIQWRSASSGGSKSYKKSYPKKFVASPDQMAKRFDSLLQQFEKSHTMMQKCSFVGIDKELFKLTAPDFTYKLKKNILKDSRLSELRMEATRTPGERILLGHYFRFLQSQYPNQVNSTFESLLQISDLSSPSEWYPEARDMKRRIIMHVGPTNSGKTYHALKRFYECERGLFCGPLRLLAHEVYERSNAQDIPCNLLTGEERRATDSVHRWACTVEMARISERFDVAIIDEIQMLGDSQRGWAWTTAFLGIQADEIHLCGEPSVIDLVKKLCELTGETVEVIEYERLSSLEVAKKSLRGSLVNVEPADCVIAFSRRKIFMLKREIENITKHRVAVIYGNLPPESRSEQAKLFNSGECQVLVASDAVGMGLNLNIRRIVFESCEKFNGIDVVPLSVSQIKQIAGRAGRFKSEFGGGIVTSLYPADLKKLYTAMESPTLLIESSGLLPQLEQLENFSKALPNETFSELLRKFEQLARISGNFFLCSIESLVKIADMIEGVPLSIQERFLFSQAPINVTNEKLAAELLQMAIARGNRETYSFDEVILSVDPHSKFHKLNNNTLMNLETDHRLTILYLWLSIRLPETFIDNEKALAAKAKLEDFINANLEAISQAMRKRRVDEEFEKWEDESPPLKSGGGARYRY